MPHNNTYGCGPMTREQRRTICLAGLLDGLRKARDYATSFASQEYILSHAQAGEIKILMEDICEQAGQIRTAPPGM